MNMPYPARMKEGDKQYIKYFSERGLNPVLDQPSLEPRLDHVNWLARVLKALSNWGAETPVIGDVTWLSALFLSCNCRTFMYKHELSRALLDTDAVKIPESLVRLPFRYVYFDWSDQREIALKAGNLEGAFLEDYGTHICMQSVIRANGVVRFSSGKLCPSSGTYTEVPYAGEAPPWCDRGEAEPLPESDSNVLNRLALNSILYINSANADVRENYLVDRAAARMKSMHGKAKRDLKAYLERTGKVFRCGFIDIPGAYSIKSDTSSGRKLEVQIVVRGHWRHYRDMRYTQQVREIPQWIQPFKKGPDLAERIEKTYRVS